ncbi:MAG: class I SAM-dependent rRNA methyltransferase [Ignavibacteriales bacterium]|nr:class I SAM-dependent rRNA methyltransferase [Ignavibacteriales bacterium]
MDQVLLRKNEEHRILSGHCWVFSNEIKSVSGSPTSGDTVEVLRYDGKFIGVGFYNLHSLIAVRLFSRHKEVVSFDFFKRRIEAAHRLRSLLFPSSHLHRLVHGESDFLPGLIIDRYGEQFSVQTLSTGMDKHLSTIADVLEDMYSPSAIVERNDVSVRALEHLPERRQTIRGNPVPFVIGENEISYRVDLLEGQKTGLFLDQRENHFRIRRYCPNAEVLDCFCNAGGFALNAWKAGAKRVAAIDAGESAITASRHNSELNGATLDLMRDDVFDQLEKLAAEKRTFDTVILDPPAFAKSKKTIAKALKGYRHLNTLALKVLRTGGILATASCSHHIGKDEFLDTIDASARKVGRELQLLDFAGASADHPVLPAMPETGYLKFAVFRVE